MTRARTAFLLASISLLWILASAVAASAQARYRAELAPTEGNQVTGWVHFDEVGDAVHVTAEVRGLSAGRHGFHIHEKGDCSAPDATSAGGHFNPTGDPHGGPDEAKRHMGDLGNLEADAEGVAKYDRMDDHLAMAGEHAILGKAVIVHAGRDDLESQPTGDAGSRLACGLIVKLGE